MAPANDHNQSRGRRTTEPERPADRPLLLNASQAAALCGVSRRTWWTLHSAGRTPMPVRLGHRTLWPAVGPCGLEAWVAAGCPTRDRWEATKGTRR
jgi:predicted DNA-binding transcriptional regulator AlpA